MSPNDLLRDADAAMYRAKARGRDCVEAFEVGGHETGVQALRTAGELRRGIERGEVVPYFQPIVDLASGRVIGYEVLARWLHPDRGLLPPGEFLPLAEETGLMVELGARMLRDSLAQLAHWRAAGLPVRQLLAVGQRRHPPAGRSRFLRHGRRRPRRDRHRRRLAVARDHRDGVALRRQVGDRGAARPAQPGPAPVGRRLRHRATRR